MFFLGRLLLDRQRLKGIVGLLMSSAFCYNDCYSAMKISSSGVKIPQQDILERDFVQRHVERSLHLLNVSIETFQTLNQFFDLVPKRAGNFDRKLDPKSFIVNRNLTMCSSFEGFFSRLWGDHASVKIIFANYDEDKLLQFLNDTQGEISQKEADKILGFRLPELQKHINKMYSNLGKKTSELVKSLFSECACQELCESDDQCIDRIFEVQVSPKLLVKCGLKTVRFNKDVMSPGADVFETQNSLVLRIHILEDKYIDKAYLLESSRQILPQESKPGTTLWSLLCGSSNKDFQDILLQDTVMSFVNQCCLANHLGATRLMLLASTEDQDKLFAPGVKRKAQEKSEIFQAISLFSLFTFEKRLRANSDIFSALNDRFRFENALTPVFTESRIRSLFAKKDFYNLLQFNSKSHPNRLCKNYLAQFYFLEGIPCETFNYQKITKEEFNAKRICGGLVVSEDEFFKNPLLPRMFFYFASFKDIVTEEQETSSSAPHTKDGSFAQTSKGGKDKEIRNNSLDKEKGTGEEKEPRLEEVHVGLGDMTSAFIKSIKCGAASNGIKNSFLQDCLAQFSIDAIKRTCVEEIVIMDRVEKHFLSRNKQYDTELKRISSTGKLFLQEKDFLPLRSWVKQIENDTENAQKNCYLKTAFLMKPEWKGQISGLIHEFHIKEIKPYKPYGDRFSFFVTFEKPLLFALAQGRSDDNGKFDRLIEFGRTDRSELIVGYETPSTPFCVTFYPIQNPEMEVMYDTYSYFVNGEELEEEEEEETTEEEETGAKDI